MLRLLPLALLLTVSGYGQVADLAIERVTLANGMDLLLHPDHKAPIAHMNFRIRVGSKYEKPGQTGMAHLFEHLIFQDRNGVPISIPAESMGATNVSGSTTEDYTEFYDTVPSSRLERMMWMESNRFAQFAENLTQENLDHQRDVVINEERLRTENDGYNRLNPVLYTEAFPPGHPYHHSVGGKPEDLRSIRIEDVRAFYAENYTPDRMTLAVTGDFDAAQVKQWAAKYFGTIPPGDGIAIPARSAPPLTAPKFIEIGERVREERVYLAWVGPAADSRDSAALEFAQSMLVNEYGPRHLYKALTDKLAQGVSVDRLEFEDASVLEIYVTVTAGASVKAIDEKIAGEVARLAKEGPSAEEMARTRTRLESDQLDGLDSIAGLASTLQYVHQFYGSIDRWKEWVARYGSVTAEDIRAAVGKWMVTPSHLTIDMRPQMAVAGDAAGLDRKTPPPFQPDKTYVPPPVLTAKLANGLGILVMERHDLPKVAVRLQFRAGVMAPPADKAAVMLLAAASGHGGKTKDGKEIDRAMADLGVDLNGDADLNAMDVRFESLRKNLDEAFHLVADEVLHTDYQEWAVEGRKKEWIGQIETPSADLDNYARPMFAAAFGAEHPLGRSLGTADSIRKLTVADVREFHDRWWKPDIAAVVFAGDITLKDAVALTADALGNWSGTAPKAAPMPPAAPQHGRIVYVDRKGVSQTMVVQVLPGVARDNPDFPALMMADRIYGNMSGARIWENIRQQHGIAYYAHSALYQFQSLGLWTIFSPVEVDKTAEAMHLFEGELAAFGRSKPVTREELDQAKSVMVRTLPEDLETIGDAAGSIAWTWAWGYPMEEMRTFPQRLAAVTLDEVNAAARKYARNDLAFFVLVGDRARIEPQVKEFR